MSDLPGNDELVLRLTLDINNYLKSVEQANQATKTMNESQSKTADANTAVAHTFQGAEQAAIDYRKEVDRLKGALLTISKSSKEGFKEAAAGINAISKTLNAPLKPGALAQALSEVNKESAAFEAQAKKVNSTNLLDAATVGTEKFIQRVEQAKLAILTLTKDRGISSLEEARQGVKSTGMFTGAELTAATKAAREELKAYENQVRQMAGKTPFDNVVEQSKNAVVSIEMVREKLKELAEAQNLPFKQGGALLKKQGIGTPGAIDTAVKELELEYTQLNNTIAKSVQLESEFVGMTQSLEDVGGAAPLEIADSFEVTTKAVVDFQNEVARLKPMIQEIATNVGTSGAGSFAQVGAQMKAEGIASSKAIDAAVQELEKDYAKLTNTISQAVQSESEFVGLNQSLADIGGTPALDIADSFEATTTAVTAFQDEVAKIQPIIKETSATTGASFAEIGTQMKNMKVASSEAVNAAVENLTNLAKAEELAAKKGNVVSQTIAEIGRSAGRWLAGTIFFTAVTMVMKLGVAFGEVIKKATDFTKTIFNLGVAVNSLRMQGVNASMSEFLGIVTQLQAEFALFSREELIQGVTNLALLTRSLGLGTDKLKEMSRWAAILSTTFGKDLTQTTDTLAKALTTGYTGQLRDMGVPIDAGTISNGEYAKSIGKVYAAMTNAEKAQATYLELAKQIAKIEGLLGDAADTTAGKVTQAATNLNEAGIMATSGWAEHVADIKLWWSEIVLSLTRTMFIWDWFWATASTNVYAVVKTLLQIPQILKQATLEGEKFSDAFWRAAGDTYYNRRKEILAEAYPSMFPEMNEVPLGTPIPEDITVAEEADAQKTAMQDMVTETETFYEERLSLQEKFSDDSRNLADDLADDLKDLERDLYNDLADQDRDYAQDKLDAQRDYLRDVEDEERDYARTLEELDRKAKEDEMKAEQEHQMKLEQLRLKFLENMEEAIRMRDARQALNLVRQYERDRLTAGMDEDYNKAERARKLAQDKEDAARDRDQNLADMQLDFQYKQEEMQRQYQQEREDRLRKYAEDTADRRRKYAEDLVDLQVENRKEEEELRRSFQAKIKTTLQSLMNTNQLTANQLATLTRIYASVLGKGGSIEQVYKYLAQMSAAYAQIVQNNNAQMMNVGGSGTVNAGNYATGGTFVASGATRFTAGEGGEPELVTVTPFSKLGQYRGGTNLPQSGSGIMSNSAMTVRVSLSDGLKYEIVDMSMDELSRITAQVEGERVM